MGNIPQESSQSAGRDIALLTDNRRTAMCIYTLHWAVPVAVTDGVQVTWLPGKAMVQHGLVQQAELSHFKFPKFLFTLTTIYDGTSCVSPVNK